MAEVFKAGGSDAFNLTDRLQLGVWIAAEDGAFTSKAVLTGRGVRAAHLARRSR
jgi:hypothetical protein